MQSVSERRIARLRARLRELSFWRVRDFVDLPDWRVDGAPLTIGGPWPRRNGVLTFAHDTVHSPVGWDPSTTRLELNLGGEGLVCLRYGDREEKLGLDPFHREFPLRESSVAITAEVVARSPFGQPNRDPRLERARLVLIDPVVEEYARYLRLVIETIGILPADDVVDGLLTAAERSLDGIDWPSATLPYLSRHAESSEMRSIWEPPAGLEPHPPPLDDTARRTVQEAIERLRRDLRRLRDRYPRNGAIALTGHAHLDLAWLWPLEETRRKARRSFHTAISLLDRYPELHFNQSSAQLYAFVEQDDPDLFAQIKQKVAAGQWEPIGGMWVEPDINMPSGESLTRQLLYGQRYFERVFGTTSNVCWLPDCFGFSPALPQLLRGAGIENFFTIKLTWSEANRFPYDLFWWEGLDGSRVLAHMFLNPGHEESDTGGYNGDTGPYAAVQTWRNYRGKQHHPESLLSVGYGDGGGGVTSEMIEQTRVLVDFPAIPELHFSLVSDFYHRLWMSAERETLPVWVGEMYLELHRGTLTTQGRIKVLHRCAERDLVAAEVLSALNHLEGGPAPESLAAQWHVLLRNEFHDILPGSSIREVYRQAEVELAGVIDDSRCRQSADLDRLAARLVPPGDQPAVLLANPDVSPRPVRVALGEALQGAQPVEGGSVFTAPEMVPGLGIRVTTPAAPAGELSVSEGHLENDRLRVTLGDNGSLAGIVDRNTGREALAGRGNQIWIYHDLPANWEAWDIDEEYARHGEELSAESVTVLEEGPHRVAVRVVRRFRGSTITQDVRLWAGSPRLDFHTTIDWHERRRLVKARFPLAVRASFASFETAFGVIERPTHRNTSWDLARFEVVGHRFADLSEPGFGVALLNDGKYGYHAIGSELGLSLLRSPVYPDPLADEGVQTFTYSLLPHSGRWLEGDVLREAEDLNRPLLAQRVTTAEPSFERRIVTLDGLPLGLGTLKAAEDGAGLILRAYEPQGARGEAALHLPSGWTAVAEADLLEHSRGEPEMRFNPFEIHTWLLRRTGTGAESLS